MTANDAFPIIDPSAVSGSSDLFGGDLFGDELLDMYNSHADTTLDDTGGVGVGVAVSTADGMGTGNTNSVVASSHQGAQVAMTAAALDDGLGAFRPSTSFNDFGSTDASPPHRPAGRTLPGSASPTIDGRHRPRLTRSLGLNVRASITRRLRKDLHVVEYLSAQTTNPS